MRPSVEKDCKKYGSVKLKKKARKDTVSETEAPYDDSLDSSKVNGKEAIKKQVLNMTQKTCYCRNITINLLFF